jgi:hypothetical protein
MSQATFDTDELFGEAASEIRGDVETHLDGAREALPDPESIWEIEAANTLGMLNALSQALDVGDAEAHLRDAKKWYTMGERADAFDDAADLEAAIEDIETTIEDIEAAHETVSDLTSTLPGIKSTLDDLGSTDSGESAAESDTDETESATEDEQSDDEQADAEADD